MDTGDNGINRKRKSHWIYKYVFSCNSEKEHDLFVLKLPVLPPWGLRIIRIRILQSEIHYAFTDSRRKTLLDLDVDADLVSEEAQNTLSGKLLETCFCFVM